MNIEDLDFQDIDLGYEISRSKKSTRKKKYTKNKISIDSIEVCNTKKDTKSSNRSISLDSIKICKNPIKSKVHSNISLDSIQTLVTHKRYTKSDVGTLSIAEPKIQNKSVIGMVAKKNHRTNKNSTTKPDRVSLTRHPYKRKEALLTKSERILYKFLTKHLPNTVDIMVKVRLADIIEVDNSVTTDSKYFYNIACKQIGFLICDKTDLSIICAVEIRDNIKNNIDRHERDKFVKEVLYDCGIRLVRLKCKPIDIEKKDIREIENLVYEYQAPKCPVCKVPMGVNESKRKRNYGHRFYGCINFPSCRENIDID